MQRHSKVASPAALPTFLTARLSVKSENQVLDLAAAYWAGQIAGNNTSCTALAAALVYTAELQVHLI